MAEVKAIMTRKQTKSNSILAKTTTALTAAVFGGLLLSAPAFAEATLSIYGGANFSPHSRVKYKPTATSPTRSVLTAWDGASFAMPPYYGVRATWWLDQAPEIGLALDYSHAKVVATPMPNADFTTLEFTDGINFVTANILYRKQFDNGFTPYAGLGVGFSVPHVEVGGPAFANRTFEFQFGGLAVQALAGVDYKLDDNWSVFGEFKSTYGKIDADLIDGGSLSTDIISNQVIIGVTYKLF